MAWSRRKLGGPGAVDDDARAADGLVDALAGYQVGLDVVDAVDCGFSGVAEHPQLMACVVQALDDRAAGPAGAAGDKH